ncbi:ergothioneine biosynthesis protein EgtB [Mycobacterium koreense]|uniref:Hercynine oxygenase n=1 Tax=Mycolicibacillus koreensis TaxID=1069220 RepID=A0A7I7SHM0_9MYCO|nr:ergothioneine biosynthesis protein EgtB [Mycolicibacillus koreensis]MCV7247118.1 ergothioneine biosynthesis protein EgtB [Mycolicibacillus koreensis]OSC28757.1 iron(II)-dependent oxidoreductase EgtB [Mycolicibacillus koreensis]BBY55931.1 hercynine oxygenase [Mycolicibacillus koreensis]
MVDTAWLAAALTRARERTLALTDFDDAELRRQYSPLLSPLLWDLAHIGQQEELWLLRGGDPARPGLLPAEVTDLYDAFTHPRAGRSALPLLSPSAARRYLSAVRTESLAALQGVRDERAAFVFAMVLSHEHQHDETMLQAHNLRPGAPLLDAGAGLPPGRPGLAGTSVLVDAGPFVLGVDAAPGPAGPAEPYALDNERPAHVVEVPAFRIGRVPVTNAEWQDFIDDGGYEQRRWWSANGWQHRCEAGLTAPQFWGDDGTRVRFGHREPRPPDEPVCHVSYFEAEAYAAWAGGRLPTEVEWEKACTWDPQTGTRRRWPWGSQPPSPRHANLGGAARRPAAVGAYPDGASAYGVEQLLGDVWEWTSSPLQPWPGFSPMIYRQYSAPFFGPDHRVLRGGSWAVAPEILRPSFRNWDYPIRRQIFAGLRVVWPAGGQAR